MKKKNLYVKHFILTFMLAIVSLNPFAQTKIDGYPDNVHKVDCNKIPTAFDFKITEKAKSTVNAPTYAIPLVGDLDMDGQTEIVTFSDTQYPGFTNSTSADYVFKNLNIFILNGKELKCEKSIETPYVKWDQPIAIGDIDGSGGEPPYIFIVADGTTSYRTGHTRNTDNTIAHYVFAYKYNKNDDKYEQAWKSDSKISLISEASPIQVADLNNDGTAELIIGTDIFNAKTGKLLAQNSITEVKPADNLGEGKYNQKFRVIPFVGNLLGDKKLELCYHDAVYSINITDKDGFNTGAFSEIKKAPTSNFIGVGNSIGADFNNDGHIDLVQVMRTNLEPSNKTTFRIAIWDVENNIIIGSLTTKEIKEGATGYYVGNPVPLVGDLNNDGIPEICFVTPNEMHCYSFINGLLKLYWTYTITDKSGITGITLFDFNQDGMQEIIYRDESSLHILDGSKKVVDYCTDLITISGCSSGTGYEMPVIADVDNDVDKTAEIIITGGDTYYAPLKVYTSGNTNKWAPARSVWNQSNYNVVNVNNDLTIPKEQFNLAELFSNGKRPFNSYLQQASFINQIGDPYEIASTPVINNIPQNTVVCYNTPFNFTATSTVEGSTFKWVRSGYSGLLNENMTPTSIKKGNSATINERLINKTRYPIEVTYTITTYANNCSSTSQLKVIYNPRPIINSSPSPTLTCSGNNYTYTPTSETPNVRFEWKRFATPGIVANGVENSEFSGTGIINELLVNKTSTIIYVNYTITPYIDGCAGNTITLTVGVKPTPQLTSILTPPSICTGSKFEYTLTSNLLGTRYIWSRSASTGMSAGNSGSATGVGTNSSYSLSHTLNSTSNVATTPIYTVNLSKDGCSSTSYIPITINPKPTITVSNPSPVCQPNTIDLTTSVSSNTPSTYTYWKNSALTIPVSNANAISNSGAYYVVGKSTEGCIASPQTITARINNVPSVSIIGEDNYCSGDVGVYTAATSYAGTESPSYQWSLTTNGLTSNIGNTQTVNAQNISKPSTYGVTVTYPGLGCLASSTKDVTTNCCTYKIGDVAPELICGKDAVNTQTCNSNNVDFILPIDAIVNVRPGVIGMDVCLKYDKRYLKPTNCIELGEVVKTTNNYKAETFSYIDEKDEINGYLHLSIYYNNTNSVGLNGNTNLYPTFKGKGNVMNIGFDVINNIPDGYEYTFELCEMSESLELSEREACWTSGVFKPIVSYSYEGKLVYGLTRNTDNPDAELPIQTINTASYTSIAIKETCSSPILSTQNLILDNYGQFNLLNVPYTNAEFELKRDIVNGLNALSYFKVVNSMDARTVGFITTKNKDVTPPTPFQMIAADVNLSDMVRANDISLIQFRSVNKIAEYPQNGRQPSLAGIDWKFVTENDLSNPEFSISTSYPEQETTNNIHYWRDNVPNVNSCFKLFNCFNNKVYGIMLGDVYHNPANNGEQIFRSSSVSGSSYKLDLASIASQGDDSYILPVTYESLKEAAVGIDFVLQLPSNIEILNVTAPADLNDSHLVWNIVENNTLLATNYTLNTWGKSGVAFNILVKKSIGNITEDDFILSYGYINDEKTDLVLMGSTSNTTSNFDVQKSVESIKVNPSPVVDFAQIKYSILENMDISEYEIHVYNAKGQLVNKYTKLENDGSIEINATELGSGVYISRLINKQSGNTTECKFSVK